MGLIKGFRTVKKSEADTERTKLCSLCSERHAAYKLTLTDLDGVLLDTATICNDCFESCNLRYVLTAPKAANNSKKGKRT